MDVQREGTVTQNQLTSAKYCTSDTLGSGTDRDLLQTLQWQLLPEWTMPQEGIDDSSKWTPGALLTPRGPVVTPAAGLRGSTLARRHP